MSDEEIPRKYPFALLWTLLAWGALVGAYLWWQSSRGDIDWVIFGVFIGFTAPLAFFMLLMISYSGEKSMLYGLKPIIERLPVISKPEGHVHFKTKMMWLFMILVLYFVLTNVFIYGLDQEEAIDVFQSFRAILAGATGSVMHLGIGPIVTGSIIMQLFTGAKIIKIDLKDEEDKAVYQSTQKLLVVIMIIVESIPQVYGFLIPSDGFVSQLDGLAGFTEGRGLFLANTIIVLQIAFGSYLVFLMDEVVSKWGIGSGISLFIAAGVAQGTVTGLINWVPGNPSADLSFQNPPAGTIPKTWYFLTNMSLSEFSRGGYESIFLQPPNPIIAVAGTLITFFFVAWTESSRIELPLSHGRARGARGRYPIKLLYASNIPVILIAALLANISMFSLLLYTHPTLSQFPLIGGNWRLGYYPAGQTQATAGLAWYTSSVQGVNQWALPLISERYSSLLLGHTRTELFIHVVSYVAILIVGSIIFAKFWIETTNMGPESVAEQIQSSGMQIPGFRRDPRVLKKVLERYIPVVTILSGAIVGGLAAGADLIGTVGNTSGTGVLLAVGIMIQTYDAMGREQLMEMHPALRGFFGSG